MKKAKKLLLWIISLIIILVVAAGCYLHFAAYQPSSAAKKAAQSATITNTATTFKAKHSQMTVIFYPGALVTPDSYSIWAKEVAKHGYTVKIAHFPLNMAFFKLNAAESLAGNQNYVIGGHSLGGAMAARYAHNHHTKHLKGIFFLGAYADEKGRLDKTNLPVLSITASRDGVLNWTKYRQGKHYLPQKTSYQTIKGGNHGNFGSYGHQKGDRKATISNHQQQEIIAKLLVKWLQTI